MIFQITPPHPKKRVAKKFRFRFKPRYDTPYPGQREDARIRSLRANLAEMREETLIWKRRAQRNLSLAQQISHKATETKCLLLKELVR